ncbi:GIY-YIG nuclease family protein [Candidatus Gottesmanbacteria bacterium]|nr:GIY-YIG nuclease family protein [Candidatus Gottesmanbacteria bacterium]
MTNVVHTTLYTGVTNHLTRRVFEHKFHQGPSFTSKYKVNRLIYYEIFTDIREAIQREKQIKAGSRQKKIDLIRSMNPGWEDLFKKIIA